jgi:hypothetical protein
MTRSQLTEVIQDTSITLRWTGTYGASVVYRSGDVISYDGLRWLAINPFPFKGITPVHNSNIYWIQLGGERPSSQILEPVIDPVNGSYHHYFNPEFGTNASCVISANNTTIHFVDVYPTSLLLTIRYNGNFIFKFSTPSSHPLYFPLLTQRFSYVLLDNDFTITNNIDVVTFIIPPTNDRINGVINTAFTLYTPPF